MVVSMDGWVEILHTASDVTDTEKLIDIESAWSHTAGLVEIVRALTIGASTLVSARKAVQQVGQWTAPVGLRQPTIRGTRVATEKPQTG